MLRRKNQLSVDENMWEALFVFEKMCVCHQFAVLFEWKEMEENMEEK